VTKGTAVVAREENRDIRDCVDDGTPQWNLHINVLCDVWISVHTENNIEQLQKDQRDENVQEITCP